MGVDRNRLTLFALLAAMALGPAIMAAKAWIRPQGDDFGVIDPRVSVSIALITVDSLSAESVRVYNPTASLPPQPAIDELARVGITCHIAFGASDREPAAAASFLTGQLASTHGVIEWEDRLAAQGLTLARSLAARGFQTGAFTNAPLLSLSGLGNGFDTRHEDLAAGPAELGAAAARWLASVGNRNFLLWIHVTPDPTIPDCADAAAAFDAAIGAVTKALQEVRWYEGTLIAAAGLFDEPGGDLMVPLIFKIPKRQPINVSRTGPCSVLDVTPTIADLVGMDASTFASRTLMRGPNGNNPLLSGYHFADRALSNRFVPGSRNAVLGLRGPQFELMIGPKPNEVNLVDRPRDPKGIVNLAIKVTERNKVVLDTMVKELFDRKPRIQTPWRAEKAPEITPATRALIERRAK